MFFLGISGAQFISEMEIIFFKYRYSAVFFVLVVLRDDVWLLFFSRAVLCDGFLASIFGFRMHVCFPSAGAGIRHGRKRMYV